MSSDTDLIERYSQGDDDALRLLIARYTRSLYSFAYRLTSNVDDAGDVVQDAFVKAWKHIDSFDRDRSFKTWLFSITRNTALDLIRKRRGDIPFSFIQDDEGHVVFDTPDESPLSDELFSTSEKLQSVENALKELSFDQRTILALHHGEGLTFEEIGETLEKPMNTVKSLYRRAVLRLREVLSDTDAPKE
jgi:RNA polymerase sigma-70 factor (ECF subfamily)